jgi:serine/threonine protein kinase
MSTNFPDVSINRTLHTAFEGINHLIIIQNNNGEKKFVSQFFHTDKIFNKTLIQRLEILSSLDHPNISKINKYSSNKLIRNNNIRPFLGNIHFEIMMDYIIEEITLDNYINNCSGPIIGDSLVTMFTQIVTGINYIHKRNLIHNNIYSKIILKYHPNTPINTDAGFGGDIKIICGTNIERYFNEDMNFLAENNLLYTNKNNLYTPNLLNEEFIFSSKCMDKNHEIIYVSPEETYGDIIDF